MVTITKRSNPYANEDTPAPKEQCTYDDYPVLIETSPAYFQQQDEMNQLKQVMAQLKQEKKDQALLLNNSLSAARQTIKHLFNKNQELKTKVETEKQCFQHIQQVVSDRNTEVGELKEKVANLKDDIGTAEIRNADLLTNAERLKQVVDYLL